MFSTLPPQPKAKYSLDCQFMKGILKGVEIAGEDDFARLFPKHDVAQPVHAVYGPADKFGPNTPAKLGELALKLLAEHAPNWVVMARVLALKGHESLPKEPSEIEALVARSDLDNRSFEMMRAIYDRLVNRLKTAPVDYFVPDFEDGLQPCSNEKEDALADAVALAIAEGMASGTLSRITGFRVKSLTPETAQRSIQTLDLVITRLTQETKARFGRAMVPEHFAITLPKVSHPEQVRKFVEVLNELEKQTELAAQALKIELMIETPRSVLDSQGRSALPALAAAAGNRLRGVHLGPHDLLRSIGVAQLAMDHPYCDFVRHQILTVFAETGVWLSDGATTKIPAGHNTALVHEAWKQHYDDVSRSLNLGLYQGWDLNAGHLVTRHAADIAFFLPGFEHAAKLLHDFVDKAAAATRSGNDFNDMATGQVWLNFVNRAIGCGAVSEVEAQAKTGLTLQQVRTSSFQQIVGRLVSE